jgi:sugar/nucleoside kinase (ribokinase family)
MTHPSGTRRAVNLVEPGGRRMSFFDARHPADLLPDRELWADGIRRARHVHVSIVGWGGHPLADAVAAGATTSTDLHDWDGENPYHRGFALGADFVFVSGSGLGDRADDVLAGILRDGRARVAVAMDGERGSRVAVPHRAVEHVPAVSIPGRPVVDSNGAGDSYVAAFLRSVLAASGEPDWYAAARAGAIAGAWACGTAGTHTSFIDADTLDSMLRRPGSVPGVGPWAP